MAASDEDGMASRKPRARRLADGSMKSAIHMIANAAKYASRGCSEGGGLRGRITALPVASQNFATHPYPQSSRFSVPWALPLAIALCVSLTAARNIPASSGKSAYGLSSSASVSAISAAARRRAAFAFAGCGDRCLRSSSALLADPRLTTASGLLATALGPELCTVRWLTGSDPVCSRPTSAGLRGERRGTASLVDTSGSGVRGSACVESTEGSGGSGGQLGPGEEGGREGAASLRDASSRNARRGACGGVTSCSGRHWMASSASLPYVLRGGKPAGGRLTAVSSAATWRCPLTSGPSSWSYRPARLSSGGSYGEVFARTSAMNL
eukprot:scaffold18385_cov42-Phaeocystis_antarctica.AAC.6